MEITALARVPRSEQRARVGVPKFDFFFPTDTGNGVSIFKFNVVFYTNLLPTE